MLDPPEVQGGSRTLWAPNLREPGVVPDGVGHRQFRRRSGNLCTPCGDMSRLPGGVCSRLGSSLMVGGGTGCIFCGSTSNKMSREHMHRTNFAKWLPSERGMWVHDFNPLLGVDGTGEYRPVDPLDMPIGGVCKVCNESWMEQLDRAAEPLVKALALRERNTINGADRAVFARWAFRTALMRGEVNKSLGWNVDPAVLREFERTREVPSTTYVRAALTDLAPGLRTPGSNSHTEALRAVRADEKPQWRQVNIVSWTLGALYVHVIIAGGVSTDLAERSNAKVRAWTAGSKVGMVWPGPADRDLRVPDHLENDVMAAIGNVAHLLYNTPLQRSDFYI